MVTRRDDHVNSVITSAATTAGTDAAAGTAAVRSGLWSVSSSIASTYIVLRCDNRYYETTHRKK